MARSLYNGGFIPSTLKQCRFRTPNQFYSMRDLRLPQPCCCCRRRRCCCVVFDVVLLLLLLLLLLLFLLSRIVWDVKQRFCFPILRRNVVPPSSAVWETKFSTSFHVLQLTSISFKAGTGKVITVLNLLFIPRVSPMNTAHRPMQCMFVFLMTVTINSSYSM